METIGLLSAANTPAPFGIIVAGGVAALVIGGLIYGAWQRRQRVRALAALAEESGYAFTETALGPGDSELAGLPLFQAGRSRRTSNMLRLEDAAREEVVFDYRYTVGSGKRTRTHHQTVIALRCASCALPLFEIYPETLLSRVGALFGGQDIDFADRPTFSRKFVLRGPNEPAIREYLSDAMLDVIETYTGSSIEAGGSWMILYRHDRLCRPKDLADFLASAHRLQEALTAPRAGLVLR